MIMEVTREEVYESHFRLLEEIREALLEPREGRSYPDFELYNTLLQIMRLWKTREWVQSASTSTEGA